MLHNNLNINAKHEFAGNFSPPRGALPPPDFDSLLGLEFGKSIVHRQVNDLAFTFSIVSAWCRWLKTNGVGIKYQQFVPSVHRSFSIEALPPNEIPNDAMEREPKKIKTATEKGALWHEYDFLVHQFVAHLRHVHLANKAIMMEFIPNTSKVLVLVKAADPLAKLEILLYYTHSKTYLYNHIFFHFSDTPTLGVNICPWMAVTFKKSFEQLLNLDSNLTGLCSPPYIPLKLVKALLFLAVAVQNQIASTPH